MENPYRFTGRTQLLTGSPALHAPRCSVIAQPGPEIDRDTHFLLVNGITFVSAQLHENEVEALHADLQSCRVAMGANKESLLIALQENQAKLEMLEDYVLTLAHTLLLVADETKRSKCAGGYSIQLTAAEARALDAAADCIPT